MQTLLSVALILACYGLAQAHPFPNIGGKKTPPPACSQDKLRKIILMQNMYFQFVEFRNPTPFPNIEDFTLCYWMKSNNLTFNHTTFSYAVPEQASAIVIRVEPTSFGEEIQLTVGGELIHTSLTQLNPGWNHFCHSWEGKRARYQVHVNGELLEEGSVPKMRGHVIPKGGIAIAGQQQAVFDGGYDRAAGIQGEITLYNWYSKPLTDGKVAGTSFSVRDAVKTCNLAHIFPRGDLINWQGLTDVVFYGGARLALANPVCAKF